MAFGSREERLNYLRGAKQADPQVRVILHYLNLSIKTLWQRIQKRNLELPEDCFHITRKELDLWMEWFTPPEEEFKLYDEYEVHRAC
jgi:predicted kinase